MLGRTISRGTHRERLFSAEPKQQAVELTRMLAHKMPRLQPAVQKPPAKGVV
jgi:hypothetical protein